MQVSRASRTLGKAAEQAAYHDARSYAVQREDTWHTQGRPIRKERCSTPQKISDWEQHGGEARLRWPRDQGGSLLQGFMILVLLSLVPQCGQAGPLSGHVAPGQPLGLLLRDDPLHILGRVCVPAAAPPL